MKVSSFPPSLALHWLRPSTLIAALLRTNSTLLLGGNYMKGKARRIVYNIVWMLLFTSLSIGCFRSFFYQHPSASLPLFEQVGGWFFAVLSVLGLISLIITLLSKE